MKQTILNLNIRFWIKKKSIKIRSKECLISSITSNDDVLCVYKKDIKIIKSYFLNKSNKKNVFIKTVKNNYLKTELEEKELILSSINFHKNLKVKNGGKYLNTYNINNKLAFFLEEGKHEVSIKFEPIFFNINFKIIYNIIILIFGFVFFWFLISNFKIKLVKTV